MKIAKKNTNENNIHLIKKCAKNIYAACIGKGCQFKYKSTNPSKGPN